MVVDWMHAWPTSLAAFLASLVEFVEALTVILAVGSVRGWRDALAGAGAALLALLALVLLLGRALTRFPLATVQLVVGGLLLMFGLRWLRKAILRAAGIIALHDEEAAFSNETDSIRRIGGAGRGFDVAAFGAAFKIIMLEGVEVVFIVIAVGAGGAGLLVPASAGALAALIVVALLGLVVHRPLSRVPENTLKFVVGVLLSGFGAFWAGEGAGLAWPGEDWSILALTAGFLVVGLAAIPLCRSIAADRGRTVGV